MATPPPLKPPAEKNNDTGMNALGELICRLNPYTRLPKDPTTGLQTGLMEVGTLPTADVKLDPNYEKDDQLKAIACIEIEVEKNYGSKWTFKGQPQNVKAAFRLPYRFPVKDKDGAILYWQTEYLLIGYAGGDGP